MAIYRTLCHCLPLEVVPILTASSSFLSQVHCDPPSVTMSHHACSAASRYQLVQVTEITLDNPWTSIQQDAWWKETRKIRFLHYILQCLGSSSYCRECSEWFSCCRTFSSRVFCLKKNRVFLPSRTTERPLDSVPEDKSDTQARVTTTTNADETPVGTASAGDSPITDVPLDACLSVVPNDTEPPADDQPAADDQPQITNNIANRFEELLPIPVRARPNSTSKRRKPPSPVLTSPEHAEFLKTLKNKNPAKQQTRKTAVEKRRAKKGRRPGSEEDECQCGVCSERYGEPSGKRSTDDWLQCANCQAWYHETCAEECGIVDVDEFICGTCYHS